MFGVLAVNNADPAGAPVVVPTHATLLTGIEGEDRPRDELVLHLARVNPVFEHRRSTARCASW